MIKRFFAFVLVVMIVCGSLALTVSAEKVDVRNGVAVVASYFESDDYGKLGYISNGTCFFIGEDSSDPQYLVTNCHVIQRFIDFGKGQISTVDAWDLFDQEDSYVDYKGISVIGRSKIAVFFDDSNSVEAYPIEYDEDKDIALLKLTSPTSNRRSLPITVPDESMVGNDTVRAVGFPAVADNDLFKSVSQWDVNDATITLGNISRMLVLSGRGEEVLQIDCIINHGNSGGPLVNDDGEVIGINTWGLSADNMYYAINTSELLPMINRNGIKADIHEKGTNTQDNSNEDSSSVIDTNTVSDSKTSEDNNTLLIVLIILGVILLLGGGLTVFFVMNKKKSDKEKAELAAQSAAAIEAAKSAKPELKPYIRSLSAQHRGMKVPITSGQVLIGRSQSDCAVVFSSSTPGVSSRHCSVSYDAAAGDFILTDLKSTYGTFLQNGQKLTPLVQYRLNTGDRFYVGVEDNMLIVEMR